MRQLDGRTIAMHNRDIDKHRAISCMSNFSKLGATPKKAKEQVETWLNRAAMAYEMGNLELSEQALMRRWQYQKLLSELEGTELPELPKKPEEFFRGWDRGNPNPKGDGPGFGPRRYDPDQPAPVPRRPLPNAGAGEIALPLPEQSTDHE
jgi:hypothetical protein